MFVLTKNGINSLSAVERASNNSVQPPYCAKGEGKVDKFDMTAGAVGLVAE